MLNSKFIFAIRNAIKLAYGNVVVNNFLGDKSPDSRSIGRPHITRPGKAEYNAGKGDREGRKAWKKGHKGERGKLGRKGRLSIILPPGVWEEVTPLVSHVRGTAFEILTSELMLSCRSARCVH
jgi:hypothetical protein